MRVGVIGIGSTGRAYAEELRNCGAEVVVAVPPSHADIQEARALGIDVASSACVIADSRLDAVVVAEPGSSRCPVTRIALENGKHVLVDSLAAVRLSDARSLEWSAGRYGVALQVAHADASHGAASEIERCLRALGSVPPLSLGATRILVRGDGTSEGILWNALAEEFSGVKRILGTLPSILHAQWIDDEDRTGRFGGTSVTASHVDGRVVRLEVRFDADATPRSELKVQLPSWTAFLDRSEGIERLSFSPETGSQLAPARSVRVAVPGDRSFSARDGLRAECLAFLRTCSSHSPTRVDADLDVVDCVEQVRHALMDQRIPAQGISSRHATAAAIRRQRSSQPLAQQHA